MLHLLICSLTGFGCLDLSPPKPLDQSKNVTVRTYHNFWEDKNGQKNAKKCQKEQKFGFSRRHVAEPGEAEPLVTFIFVIGSTERLFWPAMQWLYQYTLELAFNHPPRTGTRPVPAPYGSNQGGWDVLWFNFFRGRYPKVLEVQLFSGQYPKKVKKPRTF